MRMFNADGSEAEMCGNGIRCVAKYVYDHGIARKDQLTIETGRGVLTVDLEVAGGKVHRVRVDMGEPILGGRRDSDDAARQPAGRRAAARSATTTSAASPACRWATRTASRFVDEITDAAGATASARRSRRTRRSRGGPTSSS